MSCKVPYTSNHQELFPFRGMLSVCAFLRTHTPAGRLRSLIISPDKIQVSVESSSAIFESAQDGSTVEIPNVPRKDAQFISAIAALKKVLNNRYYSAFWRQAFRAHYIGIPDDYDNTGDYIVLTIKEIATRCQRSPRTVSRWISVLKEEFEKELEKRELIPPVEH